MKVIVLIQVMNETKQKRKNYTEQLNDKKLLSSHLIENYVAIQYSCLDKTVLTVRSFRITVSQLPLLKAASKNKMFMGWTG